MAHRCTYGEVIFSVFASMVNSDQTEGRGSMRAISFWDDANSAYEVVRGEGVMGVGDGDVYTYTFWACDADGTGETCHRILRRKNAVYDGAVARGGKRLGFGPDGWIPDYSPLLNDPDYKTYLKLKEKFEPFNLGGTK